MRKTWSIDRKWEISKIELLFEELLKDNGFNVLGIKEYQTKTDYLIEKEGTECEFSITHIDNKKSRAKLCYENFVRCYDIKVECERLKKQVERQ